MTLCPGSCQFSWRQSCWGCVKQSQPQYSPRQWLWPPGSGSSGWRNGPTRYHLLVLRFERFGDLLGSRHLLQLGIPRRNVESSGSSQAKPQLRPKSHLAVAWVIGSLLIFGAGLVGRLPPGVVAPPMFTSLVEVVGGRWPGSGKQPSNLDTLLRWATMVLGGSQGLS
jgi:hypothetical protein